MPIVIDAGEKDFVSQLVRGLTAAQPGVFAALNYRRGLSQDERQAKTEDARTQIAREEQMRREENDAWQRRRQNTQDVFNQEVQGRQRKQWTKEDEREAASMRAQGIYASYRKEAPDGYGVPGGLIGPSDPSLAGQSRMQALAPDLAQMDPQDANRMVDQVQQQDAIDQQQEEFGLFKNALDLSSQPGAEGEEPGLDEPTKQRLLLRASTGDVRGAAREFQELIDEQAAGQAQEDYRGIADEEMVQEIATTRERMGQMRMNQAPPEVLEILKESLEKQLKEYRIFQKSKWLQSSGIRDAWSRVSEAGLPDYGKMRKAAEGGAGSASSKSSKGPGADRTNWTPDDWWDRAHEMALEEAKAGVISPAEFNDRINQLMPKAMRDQGAQQPQAGMQGAQGELAPQAVQQSLDAMIQSGEVDPTDEASIAAGLRKIVTPEGAAQIASEGKQTAPPIKYAEAEKRSATSRYIKPPSEGVERTETSETKGGRTTRTRKVGAYTKNDAEKALRDMASKVGTSKSSGAATGFSDQYERNLAALRLAVKEYEDLYGNVSMELKAEIEGLRRGR